MKCIYVAISVFIFLITSSSSGITPIKDVCRNDLINNTHISFSPSPMHNHRYSISPSNKWVLEAIQYVVSSQSAWSDSVQMFLFQYCYPPEHIYLTTLYAASSSGLITNFNNTGEVVIDVSAGGTWGFNEDTVYFMVENSTINTLSDSSEVFKIDVSSITEGATKTPKQNLSLAPKLLKTSIFPNPFIGTTTIEYSIPVEGNVAINIFNARGELLKVLWQEKQKQGKHFIKWDGKDNLGNQISDGIYYYQVSSGDFISAKTIIKSK